MNSSKYTFLKIIGVALISAFLFTNCVQTEAITTKTKLPDVSAIPDGLPILPEKRDAPVKNTLERVIYTCRLGFEESPAVNVSEIQNSDGVKTQGVSVHVSGSQQVDLVIKGGKAVWDYKAVSAHVAGNSIQVIYDPDHGDAGYDWVLTIKNKDTSFIKRVRDCMEVSDE